MLMRRADLAAALDELRCRGLNYRESEAPTPGRPGNWHVDQHRASLGHELPGPPVPGGAWEIACGLVRDYEFSDPDIVRAVYRAGDELLGRDMLLEGRFLMLRFCMGVRVTEVVDQAQGGERLWGWGYQTLEGHLEQGKLVYEVAKDLHTGDVELRMRAYSRRAPIPNPVVRLGFMVFGRVTQLRFYRSVGRRLRNSVQAILNGADPPAPERTADGLVIAPSGSPGRPFERLRLHSRHPGQ
jgi:uncharacterized protein (UPF0548 family)